MCQKWRFVFRSPPNVSHEPLKDLQRTCVALITKARGLPIDQAQAVAAGWAMVADPFLAGQDDVARGLFWSSITEAEKYFPTLYQHEQRRGVAFEEGAHAVAMRVQGIDINYVTIRTPPGAGYRGAVFPVENLPRHRATGHSGRIECERWAVVELCGPIAWKLAGLWPDQKMVATHDRSAERHLLRFAPALPTANWLAHCRDQAEALLRANWPDVETIAAALMKNDILTASDIDALLAT